MDGWIQPTHPRDLGHTRTGPWVSGAPGGAPSPTRTLCFCPQSADSSRQPATLAGQFKQSLDQLMKILTGCQPSFIRCIKPNEHKKPLVTREAGPGGQRLRVCQPLGSCPSRPRAVSRPFTDRTLGQVAGPATLSQRRRRGWTARQPCRSPAAHVARASLSGASLLGGENGSCLPAGRRAHCTLGWGQRLRPPWWPLRARFSLPRGARREPAACPGALGHGIGNPTWRLQTQDSPN